MVHFHLKNTASACLPRPHRFAQPALPAPPCFCLHRRVAPTVEAALSATLAAQRGVLFARPAIVCRHTYAGRNIVAPNDDFEDPTKTDERGYLPVEWWVMSKTRAGNPIIKDGEGITQVALENTCITVRACLFCTACFACTCFACTALLLPASPCCSHSGGSALSNARGATPASQRFLLSPVTSTTAT
jgi:hypothetical protein